MEQQSLNGERIQLHTYLLMAYFFIAPMEDLLTGSVGTVAKYLALLILLVGVAEYRKRPYLPLTTANACIVWLMLVSALSVLWSIDADITLHRLISYLLIPGFCLFVSMFRFHEREYDLIMLAAILGGILGAVMALRSGILLGNSGRVVLTERNDPNNLAALLFLPFGLALHKTRTGGKKLLYAAAAVFLMLALLWTGSRGGLIGALVMVAIYVLGSAKNVRPSTVLLFAAGAVALWFAANRFLPPEIRQRMFSAENYTGTGAGRTIIWRHVLRDVIPNMGVFGLGAGCVPIRLSNFYGFYKGVHNTYLNMIAEYGVLGIPAFVIMLISMLRRSRRAKNVLGFALLAGICVIIFFLDSYAKKFFWNVILLVIIQGRIAENNGAEAT